MRVSKARFLEAVETIKQYQMQLESDFSIIEDIGDMLITPETKLKDCKMSTGLFNSLRYYNQSGYSAFESLTVADLSKINFEEFSRFRGVGASKIKELKTIFKSAGL